MTTQHTPGPWIVERTSRKDVSSAQARFEVRTPSRPFDGKPFGDWVAGDVREADALLIAAAPFMLTILKTLALHAPSLDAQGIRELCDEAIAKAEGK